MLNDLADTNDVQEIPYAANQQGDGSPWFDVVILHYSGDALHSSCDQIKVNYIESTYTNYLNGEQWQAVI